MDVSDTVIGRLLWKALWMSPIAASAVPLLFLIIGRLLRRARHGKPLSLPIRYTAMRLGQEVGALLLGIGLGGFLLPAASAGAGLWKTVVIPLIVVFIFRSWWMVGEPVIFCRFSLRKWLFFLLCWIFTVSAVLMAVTSIP